MTSRLFLLAAVAVGFLLATPQPASAQQAGGLGSGSGLNGPTVSPYLNLFQINSQGIIPYQSLVRPQIDQQNALNRQAGAIQQLQQQTFSPSGGGGGGGHQTGHTTYFMNYSHFYRAPGAGQRR